MKRSIARWTTSLAAAALLALPAAGFAQAPAGQPPSGQPPTSSQPPAQPPASQQPPATASQPAEAQVPSQQVDPDVAKQHLTAARNALSEMTQLPAASQLTGEARTQVSQLITNFNDLITAKANWRNAYERVDTNLDTLIGDATADESAARASGTAGAVGTSGAVALDPALKSKLVEVRNHLDKFEQAAGGGTPSASSPAMSGTAGTAAAPMAGAQPQSEQTSAAQGSEIDRQEILRHVQAIESILNVQDPSAAGSSGTTSTTTTEPQPGATQSGVTLSPAQVDQLRTHLSELKRLLNQR